MSSPLKRPPLRKQTFVLWVALLAVGGGMAFLQVFGLFRGLTSPTALSQAVIAREMTRGQGFHSKVISPLIWGQHAEPGKERPLKGLPDTSQAPLPCFILTPVFRSLRLHSEYTGTSKVYPLDRGVACVSVVFWVAGLGLSLALVRRFFDERMAAWTAAAMLLCQPLWDIAVGGLAPAMLLLFFSAALWLLVYGGERAEAGRGTYLAAIGIGLLGGLMVLTDPLSLCLVAGLTLCCASRSKSKVLSGLFVAGPSLLVLVGWAAWTHQISGGWLGAHRATLLSLITPAAESEILRQFHPASFTLSPLGLLRRLLSHFSALSTAFYPLMGSLPVTLLFVAAVFHPFKSPAAAKFRWVLLALLLSALTGMALSGSESAREDRSLVFLFTPLTAGFGFAFLATQWGRLYPARLSWWGRNGALTVFLALGALPLMDRLLSKTRPNFFTTAGLGKLRDLTEPNEILLSDAPWSVAWYADRYTVWLPPDQTEMEPLKSLTTLSGAPVAGVVLTRPLPTVAYITPEQAPVSTEVSGDPPGLPPAFRMDLGPAGELPFHQALPLAGEPDQNRLRVDLLFLTDRKRW